MEIGLHHPGDPVVGHEEIGLVVLFELVQQVVDALGQLKHTFAVGVAVGKLHFGGGELRAVAGRGALKAAETLFPQAGLHPRGQAGGSRHGQCGIRGAGEGRVQNFVKDDAAVFDGFAQLSGLCPAFFGQGAVGHAADLIFNVPDGLAVAGKIDTVHKNSLLFYFTLLSLWSVRAMASPSLMSRAVSSASG